MNLEKKRKLVTGPKRILKKTAKILVYNSKCPFVFQQKNEDTVKFYDDSLLRELPETCINN